ncbi:MAG TPA: hypothetical protein VGJ34_00260 [Gaiellaceae bacterium]
MPFIEPIPEVVDASAFQPDQAYSNIDADLREVLVVGRPIERS